jgi:Sucrase/ferredoxin-like
VSAAPPLCSADSLSRDEPMTATASRVDRWLLVEHRGAWGPESVPSGRMAVGTAHALAATAAAARARLLLLRRSGSRPQGDGRWVFAVVSRPGEERVLARHVATDAELVHLTPPFGPGVPDGWSTVDDPLYLVCTHGRHDRCCAIRGRPVARALAAAHPDRTWECSHIGGDRFAANLLVLPSGLYLGRVEADEVVALAAGLTDGVLPEGRVRGRSSLPSPVQAAQHFARQRYGRQRADDLYPVRQDAAGPDRWRVRLGDAVGQGEVDVEVRFVRDGAPQVLTCGAPPKTAPAFLCELLEPVS